MASPLEPEALYHLVTPTALAEHRRKGHISPPSLDEEGFVHCSWGAQVSGTVAKHFAGEPEVLALKLDEVAVADSLVEEDSYGSGQRFPHVYRALRLDEVQSETQVKP
ncbi:MAG: DUF952 domain-containing protein [Acidimicrobiales bacterium]|nr:DUF952 domain-containing protein [Acidimicrobiales bacterium]